MKPNIIERKVEEKRFRLKINKYHLIKMKRV